MCVCVGNPCLGDDIRAKNAALLRGMGVEELRKMLRACITSGVGVGGGDGDGDGGGGR